MLQTTATTMEEQPVTFAASTREQINCRLYRFSFSIPAKLNFGHRQSKSTPREKIDVDNFMSEDPSIGLSFSEAAQSSVMTAET